MIGGDPAALCRGVPAVADGRPARRAAGRPAGLAVRLPPPPASIAADAARSRAATRCASTAGATRQPRLGLRRRAAVVQAARALRGRRQSEYRGGDGPAVGGALLGSAPAASRVPAGAAVSGGFQPGLAPRLQRPAVAERRRLLPEGDHRRPAAHARRGAARRRRVQATASTVVRGAHGDAGGRRARRAPSASSTSCAARAPRFARRAAWSWRAEPVRAAQLLMLSGIGPAGAPARRRRGGGGRPSGRGRATCTISCVCRCAGRRCRRRWRCRNRRSRAGMFTVSLHASPPDLQMDFARPAGHRRRRCWALDITLVRPASRGERAAGARPTPTPRRS